VWWKRQPLSISPLQRSNLTSVSTSREAAVIGSPKVAALYYDRILPLPGQTAHVKQTAELLEMPDRFISSLLAESPDGCRQMLDTLNETVLQGDPERLDRACQKMGSAIPMFRDKGERLIYKACCECHIAQNMELVVSELPTAEIGARPNGKAATSVLVNLINLNLVDAESASWDQILALRADPAALAAMQRLRNFLFSDCRTLGPAELQDRIGSLVHEYDSKAKKHSFETRAAPCEVLLNSQAFVKALGAGALAAAISQLVHLHPASLSLATMGGASFVFDVAKAAIVRRRALLDENIFISSHPLNWVFMAKDRLESPSRSALH
jgi:hypothetical protein